MVCEEVNACARFKGSFRTRGRQPRDVCELGYRTVQGPEYWFDLSLVVSFAEPTTTREGETAWRVAMISCHLEAQSLRGLAAGLCDADSVRKAYPYCREYSDQYSHLALYLSALPAWVLYCIGFDRLQTQRKMTVRVTTSILLEVPLASLTRAPDYAFLGGPAAARIFGRSTSETTEAISAAQAALLRC